eukprot:SAG31_NODE_1448_length_8310_cov_6.709171_5_plen_134_part_00
MVFAAETTEESSGQLAGTTAVSCLVDHGKATSPFCQGHGLLGKDSLHLVGEHRILFLDLPQDGTGGRRFYLALRLHILIKSKFLEKGRGHPAIVLCKALREKSNLRSSQQSCQTRVTAQPQSTPQAEHAPGRN